MVDGLTLNVNTSIPTGNGIPTASGCNRWQAPCILRKAVWTLDVHAMGHSYTVARSNERPGDCGRSTAAGTIPVLAVSGKGVS
jgi:hypothetical protein